MQHEFWNRTWSFDPKTHSEADVSHRFAISFLSALGWPEHYAAFENWTPMGDGRTDALIAKPGARRRRDSDMLRAKRDEVFLILEFKRPGRDIDSAESRQQVEKYAVDLNAPYHVLLNGSEFVLYEWNKGAVGELLRCNLNDVKRHHALLMSRLSMQVLEKFQQERLNQIGLANETLLALVREKALQHDQRYLRLDINTDSTTSVHGAVPSGASGGELRWWGSSLGPGGAWPARVYLDPAGVSSDAVSHLVRAIGRLGLHGGLEVLYAPDAQAAAMVHEYRENLRCLGISTFEELLPVRSPVPVAGRWTICPLEGWGVGGLYLKPGTAVDSHHLAMALEQSMDDWVWKRLSADLELSLGEDADASSERLGWRTHDDVRRALRPRWSVVRAALDGDAAKVLRRHFLLSSLTPAHERRLESANLRLGPRSIRTLARALFFQLLVGEALARPLLPFGPPDAQEAFENIDFDGDAALIGHLLSVTHASRDDVLRTLSTEGVNRIRFPLLLPGVQAGPRRITRLLQLDTSLVHGSSSGRLGIRPRNSHVVFSMADELHDALLDGWADTKQVIETILEVYVDLDRKHRANVAETRAVES